jgi:hypothetical protein
MTSTGTDPHHLVAKGSCRVQCRRGTLDLGPNLAIQLVDVWPDGAGLLVMEPLAEHAEVSLVLEGPGSSRPVKRTGSVARCQPARGGYLADVEFQKRLERAELLSLT